MQYPAGEPDYHRRINGFILFQAVFGKGLPRSIVFQRKRLFEDGLTDPKFTAHPIPRNQNRIVDLQQIPVAAELIPFGQMTCSDPFFGKYTGQKSGGLPIVTHPMQPPLLSRPILRKKCLKCRTPDRTLNHFDRKPQRSIQQQFFTAAVSNDGF